MTGCLNCGNLFTTWKPGNGLYFIEYCQGCRLRTGNVRIYGSRGMKETLYFSELDQVTSIVERGLILLEDLEGWQR